MSDLERIETRIGQLRAELADLETASRVIRNLSESQRNGKAVTRTKVKPIGMGGASKPRIADFAVAILQEHGQQMHYVAVADKAIARGYKGKKNSNQEKVQKAFWATMKRAPEVFEAVGQGEFKLKTKTA